MLGSFSELLFRLFFEKQVIAPAFPQIRLLLLASELLLVAKIRCPFRHSHRMGITITVWTLFPVLVVFPMVPVTDP